MARLFVSKMKTEVKTMSQRCKILEASNAENETKIRTSEDELDSCRMTIQQVRCSFQ